jgi:hypothetical protein
MDVLEQVMKIKAEGRDFLHESEYSPLIKRMIREGSVGPDEKIPPEVLLVGEPEEWEEMSEEKRKRISDVCERLEREIKEEREKQNAQS